MDVVLVIENTLIFLGLTSLLKIKKKHSHFVSVFFVFLAVEVLFE